MVKMPWLNLINLYEGRDRVQVLIKDTTNFTFNLYRSKYLRYNNTFDCLNPNTDPLSQVTNFLKGMESGWNSIILQLESIKVAVATIEVSQ